MISYDFIAQLHGIACFCDIGFGARAVSRKTPIYFMITMMMMRNGKSIVEGTYILSGPPCKEAPAHCSRVVESRPEQGGGHISIPISCSLVGIGASAQQQERRVPGLEVAGEVERCYLGRSFCFDNF